MARPLSANRRRWLLDALLKKPMDVAQPITDASKAQPHARGRTAGSECTPQAVLAEAKKLCGVVFAYDAIKIGGKTRERCR